MVVHILTYATHSEGLFEELIHNKFDINIKILGWKQKWKGFTDKFIKSLEYISTLPDNDIIIFLDGFDTIINKNKLQYIEQFISTSDYKVIFSLERKVVGLEDVFNKAIFRRCQRGMVANSGLYCGYNKYIQILLKDAISRGCKDDQVNINDMCALYSFIGIDYSQYLFENRYGTDKRESNAMFISYPGTMKTKRIMRAIKEYTQFFIGYIIIVNFVLLLIINIQKGRFLKITNIIHIIIYVFIFYMIDTSCLKSAYL